MSVQLTRQEKQHVNAGRQDATWVCCKEREFWAALSLLISYSHHPRSHGGDESVEMSSHQMQTLFESAIYFQLTGFPGRSDSAVSALIKKSEYLLRNVNSLCHINSILPLSCLTYIFFLCWAPPRPPSRRNA